MHAHVYVLLCREFVSNSPIFFEKIGTKTLATLTPASRRRQASTLICSVHDFPGHMYGSSLVILAKKLRQVEPSLAEDPRWLSLLLGSMDWWWGAEVGRETETK